MRTVTSVLTPIAVAAAIALGFGSAHAQGIDGSAHDLASGLASNPDNNEICVYCHTPHASNDTIAAPLWNKPASGATYTTYDSNFSSTLDGTVLAVGSVSVACLSCHDGTQAMDTVINAPGSGGYNAAGAQIDPLTGTTIGTAVTNLTNDLSNDHPIGIQYGGFSVAGSQIDPDFKVPASGSINGTTQWWVDTGAAGVGTREKTDMILYARSNAGSDQPFVECASCHDPHNAANGTFLRVANDNSGVCLSCHVK